MPRSPGPALPRRDAPVISRRHPAGRGDREFFCETVDRYEKASRLLNQSGPLIKGRDGNLVKNPLHQIVRDNAVLIRSLAGELGLTPAARTSLHDANGRATKVSTTLQRLQAKRRAG